MRHGAESRAGRGAAPLLAALLAGLLAVAPCRAVAASPELRPATLMPMWLPQAQFAGYFVARDKGIYARHGIDLRVLAAGPGRSPAAALRSGEADFAVLWLTTAMGQPEAGEPLVHLAQIVQSSSLLLVARRSSGIRSLHDMDGRRVGLWGGELSMAARALFAREGITVREIAQSGTVNLFLRGGIDVASATWYNEYHTILNAGVDAGELSVVFLRDAGMDFPEDGLYARAGLVQRDPALVDAFVRASLEGWHYAFDHPEEALDIVIREMVAAHLPANRPHQRWMLARMRDLARPPAGEADFGQLDDRRYRAVGDALLQHGLISGYADYARFVRKPDAHR